MEMLDYWLRNSEKKKTWKDVAQVLKQINLGQLANEIEKVYKTGTIINILYNVHTKMLPY